MRTPVYWGYIRGPDFMGGQKKDRVPKPLTSPKGKRKLPEMATQAIGAVNAPLKGITHLDENGVSKAMREVQSSQKRSPQETTVKGSPDQLQSGPNKSLQHANHYGLLDL